MMRLTVYVPKPGTWAEHCIARGSGIVGKGLGDDGKDDGRITCYFEGNLYRIEQFHLFEDRVHRAAERCLNDYPTIARGRFPLDDLIPVGTWQSGGEQSRFWRDASLQIDDPTALEAWCGEKIPA